MLQPGSLKDKVAVVTGASRGIGKAIALQFADLGADLALVARTETSTLEAPGTIHEAAQQVLEAGGRAVGFQADLLQGDDLRALPERVLEAFGRVDILVNNAAYMADDMYDSFFDMTPDSFRRQFELNVSVPFALMKAFVPAMIERGGGVVLHVTAPFHSTAASNLDLPLPGQGGVGSAYGSSKAALNCMTDMLARELRDRHIAVIALSPGFVATERAVGVVGERFGFDVAYAISMSVPARAAAYLVSQPDPMTWTGRVIEASELVAAVGLGDSGAEPGH